MDLTPKQQTSEAIRQAETIVITTGQHPSVDQVAAVIALASILRKFGKKASAIVSDSVPQSVQHLGGNAVDRNLSGMRDFVLKLDVTKAEVDKVRYEVQDGKLNIFISPFKGGFAPSDVTFAYGDFHYDLAIVLGVPTRARIDRVFDQNRSMFETIPVMNLDFHRTNENYGAVNLIEPNASSLCEMLVALAESLQSGIIDAEIATALLMGIVASTDRFTASHTTSKSLTVAAQMMAAGARQQAVVRALYRGERNQGGERPAGERNQGGRNEQRPEREQAARREPEPRQPAQPERREEQPETLVERPAQRVPEPQAEQPERSFESEMVIIQPGHIEMSEPDAASLAEQGELAVDVPPMADFAAASEILAERQRDENEQGGSSQ